jgi:hypothetical protein
MMHIGLAKETRLARVRHNSTSNLDAAWCENVIAQ